MGIVAALHLARGSSATATAACKSCCIISSSFLFRLNSTTPFSCKSPNFYYLHLLHFSTDKPALCSSFSSDFFVDKFQFSKEIASKAASFSARSKNPQNADLLLSFLQNKGFSLSHLERIVKHHTQLLSLCVETNVKPKFKIYEDYLGLSSSESAHLVSRHIIILRSGTAGIIHTLSVLKELLGSNDHVIKLIKKWPSFFYSNPEKTLLPNIEFLKSCGVQIDQINSLIYTYPTLFFTSQENMRRCVSKCDEMGVQRTSRLFIHAVWAVCGMNDEALELKLKSFKDLGFSQDDILRMFRTNPPVFSVSTSKIKAVKEVLLESGKYDMSCIINHPGSLINSVEKRYRPRLQVLKVLESKGLITKWPSLSMLRNMTDNRFYERFVVPNINEVGEVFRAKPNATVNLLDMKTGFKSKLG